MPISLSTPIEPSWYSDMSTRIIFFSSPNRNSATAFASSVLPTPVGPEKRNEPTGFSGCPSPERAILIALTICLMAWFWPKMTLRRSSSSVASRSFSDFAIVRGGIFAIRATTYSTSSSVIVFTLPRMRARAPASSRTSIALSGR